MGYTTSDQTLSQLIRLVIDSLAETEARRSEEEALSETLCVLLRTAFYHSQKVKSMVVNLEAWHSLPDWWKEHALYTTGV